MSGRRIGVALYGTGRAGGEVVRAVRFREDLELVGAVAVTAAKEGADLGELTIGEPVGIAVTTDLDALLAREDVDVVVHSGLGSAAEVAEILGRCAAAGKDAITVAGLIHPPTALGPAGAEALERRARAGRGRIVGTGVNPGLLLDTLPAFLASMTTRIDRISARRVSDVRRWGRGVLEHEVGVGRPPAEVVGNPELSVVDSCALVADALGLALDGIEDVHEPLVAPDPRSFGDVSVAPGQTLGFRRRALGRREDDIVVEIEWLAVFCLDPEVDGASESASVAIRGDSDLEATLGGTFCGDAYPSTAARALAMIRPLAELPPGLYRPDQVAPSPRSS